MTQQLNKKKIDLMSHFSRRMGAQQILEYLDSRFVICEQEKKANRGLEYRQNTWLSRRVS